MANITIDRGESVSLGFEINGIVITDLLDLQVYVGEWVFKLSDSTITQDVSNTRLFFVKLNSNLTNRCVGTMPISLAIVTNLLGVNKESNIANLIVKETNQRTVLNDLAEYIAGTFVVTIDLAQVNTNVILQNIYRVVSGGAVDSVNGQTGVVVLGADDIGESATRLFLTPTQASDITTNNGKVGITTTQASNITTNNSKVGYTEALVNANSSVVANTAKVGITTGQASAITTNTAKVGITTTQASNITTNNAKVGITPAQSTAISDNTTGLNSKVSFWRNGIDGVTVANTLTITPTYSQLILANTFVSGDVVELQVRATSPGSKSSTTSLLIYVNTSDSLSGATQLGISNTGTSNRTSSILRVLSVKGATTKTVSVTSPATDGNILTSAMTSSSIDWTVNQYILFAIGHSVADQTMFGDYFKITK
jgi:hypothetical protein